jgi:hypothetical protein
VNTWRMAIALLAAFAAQLAHAQAASWTYTKVPDALGERDVYVAEAKGKPLGRGRIPKIQVIRTAKGNTGVVLVSPDLAFYCPIKCTVRFKFDEERSIEYDAELLPNSSFRSLSVQPAAGVIEWLRGAQRARVEISFSQAGVAVFDFTAGPLKWEE